MTPEASSRRTRSSDARGESPTACASFWMVERPSRWSAARILTSMRSNAGGRLAAIDVCFPLGVSYAFGQPVSASPEDAAPSLERFILDWHGVVERQPAAVGVDRLPGDIACLLRSEEDGNRRDLVGLADAPERRAGQYPAFGLLVGRHRFEDVGHDRARADSVDADAVGRKRERHHLG